MSQVVSDRPARWPSAVTAAIGATTLAIAVSASIVVAVYAWPQSTAGQVAKPEIIVTLGAPVSSLAPGQAMRFVAPSGTTFVMVDGGGNNAAGRRTTTGWLANTGAGLVALAADSSHLGCKVNFDPPDHRFVDPCGGSTYDINGQVLRGPAASALAHLSFRLLAPDRIAVQGGAPAA